jgi:hypothetical protein
MIKSRKDLIFLLSLEFADGLAIRVLEFLVFIYIFDKRFLGRHCLDSSPIIGRISRFFRVSVGLEQESSKFLELDIHAI